MSDETVVKFLRCRLTNVEADHVFLWWFHTASLTPRDSIFENPVSVQGLSDE